MILDNNYYYLTDRFQGNNGTWRLVGTDGTKQYAKDAVDTFKNVETGEFIDIVRSKVMQLDRDGKIKAL